MRNVWSRIGIVLLPACLAACGARERPEHTATTSQDLFLDPGNGTAPLYFGTSLPDKTLALTFDDGPGDHAAELSQYLHAQGIRAVFFVNGGRIVSPDAAFPNKNPNNVEPLVANPSQVLAQIVADGHLIANHTATHRSVTGQNGPVITAGDLIPELTFTDSIIGAALPDGMPLLFRPPYMDWNLAAARTLNGSAMSKYVGPVDADMGGISSNYPAQAADWACWSGNETKANGAPAGAAGTGFLTTTECGDAYLNEIAATRRGIILMHDPYSWASENWQGHNFTWSNGNSVDMVKYIVPKLLAAGYTFVRADEVPAIKTALPPCDPTCATCDGSKANQCRTCAPGRYFNGGSCTTCDVCGAGTYESAACTITQDTQCVACDPSCAACSGPTTIQCTACTGDEDLIDGACVVRVEVDAGVVDAGDADAGVDAGSSDDAAASADAAAKNDAGGSADAGTTNDAGAETDAGSRDAGSRFDAGGRSGMDAGTDASDDAETAATGGGCTMTTGTTSEPPWSALILATAALLSVMKRARARDADRDRRSAAARQQEGSPGEELARRIVEARRRVPRSSFAPERTPQTVRRP